METSGERKAEKLLVLDINGVFCRKLSPEETKNLKTATKLEGSKYIGGVEFRCGYEDFFNGLFARYHVAIFSSTTYKNASNIIQASQLESDKFDFLWYRDRTRFDPGMDSFETVKILQDIYDNPVVNSKRQWSDRNTIIIDDSPTKVRFNQPENVLIIRSFTGEEKDGYLNDVEELIAEKFAILDDK